MELSEHVQSQLHVYCESVKTDCKPIALFPIQERYVDKIQDYVLLKNLNVFVEPLSEGWLTIYIYKYDYLIDIIKNLPEKPQTPFEHWIIGKACGYSDSAIGEYIEKTI